MTEYTSHYNLLRLTENDLSPQSFRFSDADREIIDRLLYFGAEGHHHTGGAASDNAPTVAPSLELDTSDGTLPAATRLYYKFTYVDDNGIETTASPESFIDTPPAIVAPGAPTLTTETTGGTLNPGSYFYILTAYKDFDDLETTAGTAAHLAVAYTTATNVNTLELPILPGGADGFNVYRKGPANTGYRYLASVDMTIATPPTEYVDDGSDSEDPDRPLPTANTTVTNNSVIVTIPGATPSLPTGWLWRVYRSALAGDYTNSLLTTEDTEVTITDIGTATDIGEPSTVGTTVGTPPKVLLTDGAEVQGLLPVAYISGLQEAIEDYVGATLTDSATVDFTYTDSATPGQITAIVKLSSISIAHLSFDLQETIEDIVGAQFTDSSTIDFTYLDAATPASTAVVKPASIDYTHLAPRTTNRQTASYVLVLTDGGKVVEMNAAGANNLTVPLNSSVAYAIGTVIDILQYGAGQTTVVASGGVTIRSLSGNLKISGQYGVGKLRKLAADEWVLDGNLSA